MSGVADATGAGRPVLVRRAERSDVEGEVDLGRAATHAPLTAPYAAWCLEPWWSPQELRDSIGSLPHSVAVDEDDRVLGVANLGDVEGQPVVAEAAARAPAPLRLERPGGNQRAARFYAGHGFVETHRTVTETFPDPAWVWMRREPQGAGR